MHKTVQILKKPPENGTGREKQQKIYRSIEHHAMSVMPETKAIDDKNKRQPQGRKGVRLETGKPIEAGPGQKPGHGPAHESRPSPPGE